MAMKLKTGADLCGMELLRARLQNDTNDLAEFGAGTIYFNSTTGTLNSSNRIRYRDNGTWRSVAHLDDLESLDVASNADFKALQDKVALLAGDVDTDAIINNMKEVSAFLAGFSEDESLMEVLNGKLDKSGGTINGQNNVLLTINTTTSTSSIIFQKSSVDKAQLGWDNGLGAFISNTNSGNSICVRDDGSANFYNGKYNTLIHSGNIVEVLDDLNNATGARFFAGTFQASNRPNMGVNYAAGLTIHDIALSILHQLAFDNAGNLFARSQGANGWKGWKTIAFTDSNVASAQALVHSNGTVGATVRSNGIISISEYLILKNNRYCAVTLNDGSTERNILGLNSSNSLLVGYGTRWDGKTLIYGDGIECIIKDTPAILINSSGNVTIGGSDLAGSNKKFCVAGNIHAIREDAKEVYIGASNSLNSIEIGVAENGTSYIFGSRDYDMGFSTNSTRRMTITNSGNVVIGTSTIEPDFRLQVNGTYNNVLYLKSTHATTNESSILYESNDGDRWAAGVGVGKSGAFGFYSVSASKALVLFQPNGNVHITGNLVVDGQISAGGSGKKWSQTFSLTNFDSQTKTATFAHNLAEEDVIVNLYEKNLNNGKWEQIMADVSLDGANEVEVSFGTLPASNTQFMIVVMG